MAILDYVPSLVKDYFPHTSAHHVERLVASAVVAVDGEVVVEARRVGQECSMRSASKWIIAVSSMLALLFASAVSSAPNAESERVLIFEINGVKLYVPQLWIWPNKAVWKTPAGVFLHPNPPILPSDPPGTVYDVDRGIALFLRASTLLSRETSIGSVFLTCWRIGFAFLNCRRTFGSIGWNSNRDRETLQSSLAGASTIFRQ